MAIANEEGRDFSRRALSFRTPYAIIEDMDYVPDPDDRKFAALASAVDGALVRNDEDLLGRREQANVYIVAPQEFFERRQA